MTRSQHFVILLLLPGVLMLALVAPIHAAPAPVTASIAIQDDQVVISWPHNEANARYELHRSDEPYFAPNADTLLEIFEPPFAATIVYTDASAALGDHHVNHFYRLLSFDAVGDSVPSQRFAEFDFGDAPIPVYGYQVINAYPHDDDAFTQGLVYETPDILYESTGNVSPLGSVLRKEALTTGAVLQERQLNDEAGENYFGEGITLWGDEIPQLTWQSHVGFVYDKSTFAEIDQFSYDHYQSLSSVGSSMMPGVSNSFLISDNVYYPRSSASYFQNSTPGRT